MTEIVAPSNPQDPGADPRTLYADAFEALGPGRQWSAGASLMSSDILVNRTKDGFAGDARDASRANPYGKSALRTSVDAVIGQELVLALEPIASVLGVTEDEAGEWSEIVEKTWNAAARSTFFPMDAQRKQTFTGLMRTAYACEYVSGEAGGSIESKKAHNGQLTCLNLIDCERISDPRGMRDPNRRMGVERDKHGAPLAYHIRERHPSDAGIWGFGAASDMYKWKRVPRFTSWGRAVFLHHHEQDRPDMTRGMSSFTTALLPMRLLNDYMVTELESAAIRATYAAVIQSKLDYEEAMKVVGDQYATAMSSNPILDFTMRTMADKATFYRGQDFRFGKSKVAHLLPDEELKMIQGTPSASALKDYTQANLYTLASALGVDYASLTKNYSDTNYSGARAALYDVWRGYEVKRSSFMTGFAWPFFIAWMEEMVALRGVIPMLGKKSFYEVIDALCHGGFETWSRPRLDPLKENQADLVMYKAGAMSLRTLCRNDNLDYRAELTQRSREKALMKKLDLEPQDIDWDLIMNAGKDKQPGAEGTGSEGGASTGSSSNG